MRRTGGERLGAVALSGGLLLVVAYGAAVLRRPVDELIGVVPDDAFYYLQIARRIATEGRSTFDGLHPTNGYHPAWMAVCVLLAKIVAGRTALLRAALATGLLLHCGAAFALRAIVQRFSSPPWPSTAAALWLVNPFALLLATQALETPLYLLALGLTVVALLRARSARATGPWWLVGAAFALLFLARTDSLLYFVATAIWIGMTGVPQAGRAMVRIGVPLAAAMVAWFALSYAMVGSPLQDSAMMKSFWAIELGRRRSLALGLAAAVDFIDAAAVYRPVQFVFNLSPPQRWGLLFALPFGLAAYAMRRATEPHRLAGLLIGALLVTLLAQAIGLGTYMLWYSALPLWTVSLLVFVWLGRLLDEHVPTRHRRATVGAALAAGLFLFTNHLRELEETVVYPWQIDVYRDQPRFAALVPGDQRIGMFNAGIPGYFGDRPVVNLDGLVNHSILGAWRSHRFAEYLRDEHVHYLLDEEDALNRALNFSRPFTLRPIAVGSLRGWTPPRRILWRIEP